MNYSTIKSTVLSYADRADDTEVVAAFDSFLAIVESKLNRVLQTRGLTKKAYIPTVEDKTIYALPPDFSGVRILTVKNSVSDSAGTVVGYRTPEVFNASISGNTETLIYTLYGNNLQVYPAQTDKYLELIYYARITPLNSVDNQNVLSDIYPDAYIFGLLVEVNSFVKDFESASAWNDRYERVIGEMDFESDKDQWSSPSLQIKVA